MTSRRAVAPVIATLLLVAIAVVGGSIIFVFSQGFFSSAQISGSPQIESIKILGYDATDGSQMQFHDGYISNGTTLMGSNSSDGLNTGEFISVYLKNDSVNKITISEIRVAGDVYVYEDLSTIAALPAYTATCTLPATGTDDDLDCAEYTIIDEGFDGTNEAIPIESSSPSLEPGQQATLVFALEKDVKSGRDLQFKLSTASGAVFVSTINTSQQSG